jgi:hypothetical protein
VDGIFGSSLFQHFQIRVDYEHGEVTFVPAHPSHNRNGDPIKLYGGVPFVEAAFETATGEKVPALFLVDSGTAGELILSRKFIDAHPSVAEGHVFVNIPPVAAVGGVIEMDALRITGLDLGLFHLTAPVAAIPRNVLGALANPDVAGFIGAGILSRFTVDWDYEGKTMTLTPNHRYGGTFRGRCEWTAVSCGEAGLEDDPRVGSHSRQPRFWCRPGTGRYPAVKVNGKVPPPLYELDKLLALPGASITITILRSGKQKTMTIHLRRLV